MLIAGGLIPYATNVALFVFAIGFLFTMCFAALQSERSRKVNAIIAALRLSCARSISPYRSKCRDEQVGDCAGMFYG